MKFSYDRIANAAYVTLRPGVPAWTDRLDAYRLVDRDCQGRALRVEFLDFRNGIDLTGLDDAERIRRVLPARTRIVERRQKILA